MTPCMDFIKQMFSRCESDRKKMINGSRYYRALETVSISSALGLSSALPMPDSSPSYADGLKLPTSYSSEEGVVAGWPQRKVYPRRLPVNCGTH